MYLKASSLLESVIAITILSICSLISIKLYTSVLDTTYSYNYIQAKSKMDQLIHEFQQSKTLENAEIKYKDFKIKKNITFQDEKSAIVMFKGLLKTDTISRAIKISR